MSRFRLKEDVKIRTEGATFVIRSGTECSASEGGAQYSEEPIEAKFDICCGLLIIAEVDPRDLEEVREP